MLFHFVYMSHNSFCSYLCVPLTYCVATVHTSKSQDLHLRAINLFSQTQKKMEQNDRSQFCSFPVQI